MISYRSQAPSTPGKFNSAALFCSGWSLNASIATPVDTTVVYYGQWTRMQANWLPDYVHQEFDEYLKCDRLEYGFLRVQCDS